jgi:NTE family protein
MSQAHRRTALVLSGGGARGAYEAGVVAGIAEVVGRADDEPPLFDIYAGTSVGAINATYLASHTHLGDLGAPGLLQLWTSLSIREYVRVQPTAPWRRALLDVDPFDRLVARGVDWKSLRTSIDSGRLCALIVAALHIEDGRTTMFVDLAPGETFTASKDPHRFVVRGPITANHVLASAAIPGIFPPRAVEGALYYDGGLRFNTPMAPAIRAGARRLVVVSPLYTGAPTAPPRPPSGIEQAPGLSFLLGKLLHAILLDPFAYDLQVLGRFNQVMELLDQTLDPEDRARLDAEVTRMRGMPYRSLDVLALSPSVDLGGLALEHLNANRSHYRGQGPFGWLLWFMGRHPEGETDLLSYLLFDAAFTRLLTEQGRRDAHDQADTIRAFFSP